MILNTYDILAFSMRVDMQVTLILFPSPVFTVRNFKIYQHV